MSQSFLNRLRLKSETLSPSEGRVAAWVLENPAEALNTSLKSVAEICEVSEPTVIRFCRSMGLAGYRELKTELMASLHRAESYLHSNVGPKDEASLAAAKVLESSISGLVATRTSLHDFPFDEASDLLASASQIVFFGFGASGFAAQDACHKFFRLGIPCAAATDTPSILQHAAVRKKTDVVIVISNSGEWSELSEGVDIARARGATVIGITDPLSKLANTVDLLLPCEPLEDPNLYTPMSSRLVQLVILDALQVCIALKMGKTAEDNLRDTKEALSSRRLNS